MSDKNNHKLELKKGFLKNFLNNIKANYIEEGSTFQIIIPDDFLREFGERSAVISLDHNVENISFKQKSLFFERLYKICSNRGEATSFILEPRGKPIDIIEKINFKNLKVEREGSYKIIKYGILFTFIVTVIQPEYLRKSYQLVFDLENLKPLDWITPTLLELSTCKAIVYKKEIPWKKIRKAYRNACILLEKRLSDDLRETVKLNEDKLQKDLARISRYYQRLRGEEENRVKRLESQLILIEKKIKKHRTIIAFKRYYKEQHQLKRKIIKEKVRMTNYLNRLAELEQKDKARERRGREIVCKGDLIAIGLIQYPKIQERLLLFKEDAKAVLNIDINPIHSDPEWPVCQSCKKPTSTVGLCSDSHVTCATCSISCSLCAKKLS